MIKDIWPKHWVLPFSIHPLGNLQKQVPADLAKVLFSASGRGCCRASGGVADRQGANLSDTAGTHRRRFCRWRRGRHRRTFDRLSAVGTARPAAGHRESAGRWRQYRHRGRRPFGPGRLYVAPRRCDQRSVKLRKHGRPERFRGIVGQTKAFAALGPGAEPRVKHSSGGPAIIEVLVDGLQGSSKGTFQISWAYSPTVRSEENHAIRAMLSMLARVQSNVDSHSLSTLLCVAQ
jgi:hypothetical protein